MKMKELSRVYDTNQLKDKIRKNGDSVIYNKKVVTGVEFAKDFFLLYYRKANEYFSDFMFVGLLVRREDAPNGELFILERYRPWLGAEYSLEVAIKMKKDVIAEELKKLCDKTSLSRPISNSEMAMAKREALDIIATGKHDWFEPQISDEEAFQTFLGIRTVEEAARDNFVKHSVYMQRKLIAVEAEKIVKDGLNESEKWKWCLDAASSLNGDYINVLFRHNRRKCEARLLKEDFLEMLAEGSDVAIKASDICFQRGDLVFRHLFGKQYTMNSVLTLDNIEEIRGEF